MAMSTHRWGSPATAASTVRMPAGAGSRRTVQASGSTVVRKISAIDPSSRRDSSAKTTESRGQGASTDSW